MNNLEDSLKKIEVEPGTILLQDPVSGETLRFRSVEKGGKTEKEE